MLSLQRINYPEHEKDFLTAWDWARTQPDLYGDVIGFYDFTDFVKHQVAQIDFALKDNEQLIAFASLVLRARKVCEFELITPPRPRVRSILALLALLQREYFENLGFVALYTEYPDDPRFDRPRRLCRLFGWREPRPNYFEWTIHDQLRLNNGQDTENCKTALRADGRDA